MSEIVFARPGLFALLLIPLIVLWFARRAASRPHVDATGTLEIWQRSAPEAPQSATKPRIPLSLWFVVIALVFGTLALAGPRSSASSPVRTLLVVVDRSPSMYLRDGSRTRLEHALELARATIARLGYDRVAWIAPPIADDETRAPASLPSAWLAAPQWSVKEPDFASFDRPNTLFVTDRAPAEAPRFAGLAGSGGAAVPGHIGLVGNRSVAWDGVRLVETETALQLVVHLEPRLPEPIARIATAWATARGLALHPLPADGLDTASVLALYGFDEHGSTHPCRITRDGWSARAESAGPLRLRDEHGALAAWLATTEGEVVVAHATGRVRCALRAIEQPDGDPAAWAVSWSQLFDDALALPRGCVSLVERSAAGEPFTREPQLADAGETGSIGPWTALAAGSAALFALAAAGLGFASARERSVAVR